jgi:YidC/Oxa1 family membrane protein insertase
MEFQRLILIVAIAFASLMLWNAWEKDYGTKPFQAAAQIQTKAGTQQANIQSENQNQTTTTAPSSSIKTPSKPVSGNQILKVSTDVLNINIDLRGGNIVGVTLPKYPKEQDAPSVPFTLLSDVPENYYIAQSTLSIKDGKEMSDAELIYQPSAASYSLPTGENDLQVKLISKLSGLMVTKIYTFKRDSYLIALDYKIENPTNNNYEARLYTQLTRKKLPESGGFMGIHPYVGAAISTPTKRYDEVSYGQMQKQDINLNAQGGWAAMVQHYFLSAWVPPAQQNNYFYSKVNDDLYTIGFAGPNIPISAKGSATTSAKLYTGPEITDVLSKIAPGLDLTISYGWLWPISVALFWVLKLIYEVVGNWGWAIVIITILIKLAFYHLSAKSYFSMAKMRKLQPRIEALRERHTDDKQKFSQAMMELYKKEKVNPLGGCLPILVQIPVFFALYMVLIESVELRHAPWILWIRDLSQADPYFILPILMGLTMFIQQRLSPPPPDPTQAKVMMFLPAIFTVLFIYFPAGLVLYWVVNNALSVLQQWYVTYRFELAQSGAK